MTQMPGLFDPSEFEKFEGVGTRRKDPAIGIQTRGSISINAEAFNEMGRPEFVELFYNPLRGQIMLKAADKGTPGAARTRQNGNGMGALVASKAFFDAYGIIYAESKTLQIIHLAKGVAAVQLPDGNGERQ